MIRPRAGKSGAVTFGRVPVSRLSEDYVARGVRKASSNGLHKPPGSFQ